LNPPGAPRAPSVSTTTPRAEYERRLLAARQDRATLDARELRLGNARLGLFVAGLVVAWLAWGAHWLSGWWVLAPVALFAVLVVAFDRAARQRRRAEKRVAYYERAVDRLEGRWAGRSEGGARFREADHPYADDLDLFGPGSLFERISAARTHVGEDTLAAWLKAPARVEVVRARQEAVAELRPGLDLREDAALLGGEIGTVASFEGLADWGASPVLLRSPALRVASAVLAVAAVPALVGWLCLVWSGWPIVVIGLLEAAIHFPLRARIESVLSAVEKRSEELGTLAGLLARLEAEPFESAELRACRDALLAAGRPASRRIEALRRLVATLDARRNMLLGPISPLLLWGTQVAFAVEAWRAEAGQAIGGWLEAVGRFEALASLAGFAFEGPDDVFPDVLETDDARFEAEALAHPLIPEARAVRNDVRLGGPLRVLVISGSNMSGKSTLLRAVGSAVVLAMAGGTVRAARLTLSPLAVGASLRVQDSLQQGRSRFYAEILRLRLVLDLARAGRPLLFLLDEVLAGTNSHDRRLGAEAVVNGLVDRGAIGLVTTHDLALAEIVGRLGARAENVHFADHLEDGVMTFDYTLRPGVVRHSNALALMRSVGLDV
jgi:hypothetical protein